MLPESTGDRLANAWFGDSVTNDQLGTTSGSAQHGFVQTAWKAFSATSWYLEPLNLGATT